MKQLIFAIILLLIATSGCINYKDGVVNIQVESKTWFCNQLDSYALQEEFILDINENYKHCEDVGTTLSTICDIYLTCEPSTIDGKCVCIK